MLLKGIFVWLVNSSVFSRDILSGDGGFRLENLISGNVPFCFHLTKVWFGTYRRRSCPLSFPTPLQQSRIPTRRTVKQPVNSFFGVHIGVNEVFSPTCPVGAFCRNICQCKEGSRSKQLKIHRARQRYVFWQ